MSVSRYRIGRWALGALLLFACDPGPDLPRVRRVRIRSLSRGVSAQDWPVLIEGTGFATTPRYPLRFGLWRFWPAWPRVRVDLEKVRIRDHRRAQAVLPAGTPAGLYRLVAFRGARWRSALHRVRVRAPGGNRGYPTHLSLRVRDDRAGAGGRLVISGANLEQPALVTLHGPHRRQAAPPRKNKRWKPKYRRLPIAELGGPRSVTPTRVTARLPGDLAAGRYFVQVYTSSARGNPAEYVLTLRAAPDPVLPPLVWALALPLLLIVLCGLFVPVLGRPLRARWRTLLLVLGGAVGWAVLIALLQLISR